MSALCCSTQCDSLACFNLLLYSKYSHFSYACLSCSHFQGKYSSFRLHAFSGTRRWAQKSLYPSGIFAFCRSSCTTTSKQFSSVQLHSVPHPWKHMQLLTCKSMRTSQGLYLRCFHRALSGTKNTLYDRTHDWSVERAGRAATGLRSCQRYGDLRGLTFREVLAPLVCDHCQCNSSQSRRLIFYMYSMAMYTALANRKRA